MAYTATTRATCILFTQLVATAKTLEELVIYQALQGDFGMWARPVSMFLGSIEHEGASIPRFSFVSDPVMQAPATR